MRYQRAELPLKLDGLKAAQSFFAGCLAEQDPTSERLWVAHVDAETRCLHLSSHGRDQCGETLPTDEILADAVAHQSAGLLLAHRREGAGLETGDCQETRELAALASALDCTVIDHLVFTAAGCSSLRRSGCL